MIIFKAEDGILSHHMASASARCAIVFSKLRKVGRHLALNTRGHISSGHLTSDRKFKEQTLTDMFDAFDQVRIINLVDRPDRRLEMERQLARFGVTGSNVRFFDAHRPASAAEFPSLGARGCFESHLAVLSEANASSAGSLLLLEDDFDFTRDGAARLRVITRNLNEREWDFFYGAHNLLALERTELAEVPPSEPVLTASFVGFSARVLGPLVEFLQEIMKRPAGSPDYGPMHVDGAYTVFRELNPRFGTFAAFPPLGRQRSSPSDITPKERLLERWGVTRQAVSLLRIAYNRWQRG